MRPAAIVSTLRFLRRSETPVLGDAHPPARLTAKKMHMAVKSMTAKTALRGACLGMISATLLGCSAPPDLHGRVVPVDTTAPWPTLLTSQSIAELSATQTTEASATDETVSQLAARAAALRARAARLTGPILDTDTRTRLQASAAPN